MGLHIGISIKIHVTINLRAGRALSCFVVFIYLHGQLRSRDEPRPFDWPIVGHLRAMITTDSCPQR